METTIIPVRRFVVVEDTLDLAPILARFPGIRPDRIVMVVAHAVTMTIAAISLRYDNGVLICSSFEFTANWDAYVSASGFRNNVALGGEEAIYNDEPTLNVSAP